MKLDLNRLETRLQSIIERSAHLFPWGDNQIQVSRNLTRAMREALYQDDSGRWQAASYYVISLPANHPLLTQNRDMLANMLINALNEAARETGVIFLSPPVIDIRMDPLLAASDVRVTPSREPLMRGETASIRIQTVESNSTPDISCKHAFLIINGTQTFLLNQPVTNIGRREGNHLVITDPRISRAHAQIRSVRGQYVLFDLNATGGTFVNDERVTQHVLKPGDVISLAGFAIIYGEDTPALDDTGPQAPL